MSITYDTGSANTLGANSATVTTASITTAENNELLISFFFGADNTNVSLFTAATSPNNQSAASGAPHIPNLNFWGEVADNITTTGADTGNAFAHAIKVTAGATGTLQTTAGNSSRHGLIVGAFKLPLSAITLNLANLINSTSPETFSLTQQNLIQLANIINSSNIDSVSLSQANSLLIQSLNQDNLINGLVLDQAHILDISHLSNVNIANNILLLVIVRYGRPISDLSLGTWTPSTGTDLYAMLDEVVASDTDYITTASASTCEVALNAVTDPVASSGQVIIIRAQSAHGSDLVATLKQGAMTIATRTFTSLGTSWADYIITLTSTECDAITDYSALSISLEAK